MNIKIGTVGSYSSKTASNIIRVNLDNTPASEFVDVIYTAPNYQRYYYGVVAHPEPGSKVLILFDGYKYYYLSTIVEDGRQLGTVAKYVGTAAALKTMNGVPKETLDLFSDSQVVDSSGNPATMFFRNRRGSGLKITSLYEKDKPIVNNAILKTTKNHHLMISDSLDSDGIMMKNCFGDGVTIAGEIVKPGVDKGSNPNVARGIKVYSENTQQHTVNSADYLVRIVDGREISIVNESKGSNRIYVPEMSAVSGEGKINAGELWGNLNLVSKFKNINIYTDNPSPRADSNIFITTQGGMVQINSGGDVKIFAKQAIQIQAESTLNLVSVQGAINVDAKAGDINIKGNNVNIEARSGNANIKASGLANVGGTTANVAGTAGTNVGNGSLLSLNKSAAAPGGAGSAQQQTPKKNLYNK